MVNFCTNCGARLRRNANFCTNCGTKINKSDVRQHDPSLIHFPDSIEKKYAKKELNRVAAEKLYRNTFINTLLKNDLDMAFTGKAIQQQVEKEINSGQIKSGEVESRVDQLIQEYKIKREEAKKKLKMIDEILESEEIKSEISKNNIDKIHLTSIRDSLKNKLIKNEENMSEDEIKRFIKTELEKVIEQEKVRIVKEKEEARIAKEKREARIAEEKERKRRELEWIETHGGGYCSLSCRHCYEEFFDSGGGIVGDFDGGGYVEYYCNLGHSVSYGSFCKDYE